MNLRNMLIKKKSSTIVPVLLFAFPEKYRHIDTTPVFIGPGGVTICVTIGCRSDDYRPKMSLVSFWFGANYTKKEMKQYEDGGETIRRLRRNNTSMEAKQYVDGGCPMRGTRPSDTLFLYRSCISDALNIWDSMAVNNSMSAPALLACKARTMDADG